jgi:hypothetical protein
MQWVMLYALTLALSACGGGGSSSSSTTSTSSAAAVGSTSSTDLSGLRVADISQCSATTPSNANEAVVCVDSGPYEPGTTTRAGYINQPFVTVRLCAPGSTTNCVNIEHMLVDTGSTGVRVAVNALSSAISLPAITNSSGAAVAECMNFVSGYIWGSLNQADVYIGGLVARSVPIHLFGQSSTNASLGSGAFPTVPTACSTDGSTSLTNLGSVGSIGGNGIIGLSTFLADCGTSCATTTNNGMYFTCSGTNNSTCSSTRLAVAKQPQHLASYFSSYPGGTIITMPAVSGGYNNLPGLLSFGVSSVPSSYSTLTLNGNGYFTAAYNGNSYTESYIDSGSNGVFIGASSDYTVCSGSASGFYCPSSSVAVSVTNVGSGSTGSNTVTFTINNIQSMLSANPYGDAFPGLAGPATSGTTVGDTVAWGFPFFFGRSVYTILQGTTLGGSYGAVAYN